MKHLISLLAVLFLLAGCSKDTTSTKQSIKLDPNAHILIRPAQGVRAESANPLHLSALEIVRQTEGMSFHNDKFQNELRRGFADSQRDFNLPALKMWGTDIIDQDGKYVTEFIDGYDIILWRVFKDPDDYLGGNIRDTIGYIPNAVIVAAREPLKAAYDAGNYEEVYKLFDTAFTFIPITGAEWLALKAKGQQ